jgi:hypothetical protein
MQPNCSFKYLMTRIQEIEGTQEYLLLREMARRAQRPLWTAFNALGLDRVVAGARALHADNEEWEGCFLSLAHGERGELVRELDEPYYAAETASQLLGVGVEDAEAIIQYFDADIGYFRRELLEWPQAHGANPTIVLRETRREVKTQHLTPARQAQLPDLLEQLSGEQVELLNSWIAYVRKGMPPQGGATLKVRACDIRVTCYQPLNHGSRTLPRSPNPQQSQSFSSAPPLEAQSRVN